MSEGQEKDTIQDRGKVWKKVGKALFLMGFIFIISTAVLSLVVSFAGAYSGSVIYVVYDQYAYPLAIAGGFLIFVGILSYLWGEGFNEKLVWSMKMGAFGK